MTEKLKQKPLPKGISYRPKEQRYMGRFMYHGESFVTYGKTVKETEKNLKELRYQVEHGTYFKNNSITFNAWFDIWIRDYKEPESKAGTVNTYTQNYNAYIKPIFGHKQMGDVRTDQIQRFYNGMSESYSRNTMEVCRAIINGMYMQAITNELLQKNPVSNARLPKNNKKKTAFALTEQEQSLFLLYAKESDYYPLYELALSTGMRSGELRGLQWNDIDFKNQVIHISHTLVYYDGKTFLDSPKTSSSERDIPMLNNVEQLLKQQHKRQLEQRISMGEWWSAMEGLENLTFTNKDGKPIFRDRFKRDMDKIVKRINEGEIPFPHITPHTLRHTFATRSIERGIPYKVLQTILGHSDLSTTMDIYAHVLPDTKACEMQKLAGLFS